MGNFRQIPEALLYRDDVTLECIRVFAAVQYHGRGGRGCFAAVARIAQTACCDTRTVQRWLKKLCIMGFLDVERATGRGNASTYRLCTDYLKGDNDDTLSAHERVTAQTIKGDSASANTNKNQGDNRRKDSLNDSSVKRKKDSAAEAASLLRSDVPTFTQSEAGNRAGKVARAQERERSITDGEYLARLERSITRGQSLDQAQLADHYMTLENIQDARGGHAADPLAGWAYRIQEMVAGLMTEDTWRQAGGSALR